MNRRQICTIIFSSLMLVVSFNAVIAQSKRIDNPTPLTSNEISGVIDENTKDDTYYYYSFWANPGEVKITATVERNLNIDNNFSLMGVEFILYDSNSEVVAKKTAATYANSGNQPAVAKAQVQITKRQTLILAIKIPGGVYFGGIGKYKVQIDGADIKSKTNSSDLSESFADSLSAKTLSFPEKGFLFAVFVKGGIQINLSSVKSISITDPTTQLKIKELNYGKVNLPKEGELRISMKDGGFMHFDLSQISSVDIF